MGAPILLRASFKGSEVNRSMQQFAGGYGFNKGCVMQNLDDWQV